VILFIMEWEIVHSQFIEFSKDAETLNVAILNPKIEAPPSYSSDAPILKPTLVVSDPDWAVFLPKVVT